MKIPRNFIVVAIVIAVGLMLASSFGFLSIPKMLIPPKGHQEVINRIKVTTIFHDVQGKTYDYALTPELVFIGWEPELPPPDYGENLPESVWIYRHNWLEFRGETKDFISKIWFFDVGMTVKVWGPFPSSGSYVVEFSRLNGGLMKIYIDGQLRCTFDWATQQPALGYYSVSIEGR